MTLSKEMRLLDAKWQRNTSWPKMLETLQLKGLRGWRGQPIDFKFPIVAICGENGSGKSTIIQSAASVYQAEDPRGDSWYGSDFFLDSAWDKIGDSEIGYVVREDQSRHQNSVRKLKRWRGNRNRRRRTVTYIDLSRLQPVSARTGYLKIAKSGAAEASSSGLDAEKLARLGRIMGRDYSAGRIARTVDVTRPVPVFGLSGVNYSGFNSGAGELTAFELLSKYDPPPYSLVLIDEVETSLHPRSQRHLIRDLAELARTRELQIILTTHSPYILSELPPSARGYVMFKGGERSVMFGVSPEYAMSKMDDKDHTECDVYVEDHRSRILLLEILMKYEPEAAQRIRPVAYGAASVGRSLGQMAANNRFPDPAIVFLDGDQEPSAGCIVLPGNDAPERVVFDALKKLNWALLDTWTTRDFASIAEACNRAMTSTDHHDWLPSAANALVLEPETLWQAMCAEWTRNCLPEVDGKKIATAVLAALPQ